MTGPQLADGYTRIANTILEQMAKVKLSPTQYRILFIVWRYTYGFQRKSHQLSLSFLAKATGCDRRQIQREVKRMLELKILIEIDDGKKTRTLQFNKQIEDWDGGETVNGKTVNGEIDNDETIDSAVGETVNGGVGETVNSTGGETVNQERKKERSLKKELKEKVANKFDDNSTPYQLAKHLRDEILKKDSNTKVPKNLQKWALSADRMLRLDDRDPAEAMQLMTWAQEDNFWNANILSMDKFRKQYDRLKRASQNDKSKPLSTHDVIAKMMEGE